MIKLFYKLLALTAVSASVISVLSKKWLQVNHYDINIKNLPNRLNGFKILQISDLHSDSNKKINVNIWKNIDSLGVDIIVITGDIINKNYSELNPHKKALTNVAKKYPTYFCIGNHDIARGYANFIKELESMGIIVLDNNTEIFDKDGAKIEVTGISYTSPNLYDIISLMKRSENIKIVLSHSPNMFDVIKHYQPDLTLSGHNHAGQLRLPFAPVLFAPDNGFFPKYGYGLYKYSDAVLFVSKGIGTTHFPFRFWNRPEIVVLTLKNNCSE